MTGLSPRGRGNPPDEAVDDTAIRSIPAWVGELPSRAAGYSGCKVYPRVGGGTVAEEPPEFPVYGLSPRGRGNRPRYLCAGTRMRSIPAWAGEPPGRLQSKMGKPVYPRVGGGTSWTATK